MDKSDVQKDRGLNVGRAFEVYGQDVNRIPHGTGNVGRQGSAKAQTHDHGNKQAIDQGKREIKAKFGASALQPSQVRTKIKSTSDTKLSSLEKKDQRTEKKNMVAKFKSGGGKKSTQPFDPFASGNPNRK